MRLTFTFILLSFFAFTGFTQKVLQIETYGKARTSKIFIGQGITYQLKDSKNWQYAVIEDLLVEQGLIETARGYVKMKEIKSFRFERRAANAARTSLFVFGTSWSLFAVIGYATDGNPETKYSKGDAIVTASSIATGWLISKLFRFKIVKFGKRKWLRMLEIPFKQ